MLKRIENGVRIYPDGREVCQDTAAGQREYSRRREEACIAQRSECAICGRLMWQGEVTLDHKQPRGMGGCRRDDRQENIQAVHALCNSMKGSRRT